MPELPQKLIVDFLAQRFAGAVVARARAISLRARLQQKNVSEPLIEQLLAELDNCDFARFAPGADRKAEADAALSRAEQILTAVDLGAHVITFSLVSSFAGRRFRASPMPRAPARRGQERSSRSEAYEQLQGGGLRNADLEYNLGTSYGEQGDLGQRDLAFAPRRAARARGRHSQQLCQAAARKVVEQRQGTRDDVTPRQISEMAWRTYPPKSSLTCRSSLLAGVVGSRGW